MLIEGKMNMKKSIAKNYIYNLIFQILNLIVPLITMPYVSQILGAEKIGIYSYTLSIATYFILFGTLGVAMYGQREIAYVQDDKYNRSKKFIEILIMRFITLSISLFIFYLGFCRQGTYIVYYRILLVEIFAYCLDISWYFQGLEEFKKTAIRSTVVKFISVICIFIFVKTEQDLIKYIIIATLSTLVGNLSLWIYLPRYIEKVKIKDLKILSHLKPTISLFIPQIAIQVYTVLDKTMIGFFIDNKSEVGVYEQAQKIVKVPLTLISALGTVVSPRIANAAAKNKNEKIENYLANSFRFVWFLGIPSMFGIMGIANNFVPWFLGENFNKSITIIMIGAPIIMAIGLSNVSGIQYLVATKRQNLFTKSVIIGAIFNFITNLILIPNFKATGAMIASVFAEFLILIVQLIDIRKDIPIKIVYKDSIKYIISGVVMFIVIFNIGFILSPSIKTTLIQILTGMVIYVIMLMILKDKMLYDNLNKIKKKVVKSE